MDVKVRNFLNEFYEPPRKYTLIPFWFLNDEIEEEKIYKYLRDFLEHGVYGVIPHPRIGLPKSIGFMSERWLYFVRLIVDFASKNDMIVILYDEGMYPSGSCAGKVVAKNPLHSARAIVRRRKGERRLESDEELIFEDGEYEYVHTRSKGVIRGIHFGEDDNEPGAPPAGDILNPDAVESFLQLVLDEYYKELGEFFGKTVIGIFTDEPNPLGRKSIKDAFPWTWGMLDYANKCLGYDFREALPYLWKREDKVASKFKRDFERVVQKRLEEAFYRPYQQRCERYGIYLTGHPKGPMDLNVLKYFHIPGQDIVWRWIEPYKANSIEGPESTGPKCSVSAKVNFGRNRNLNECFGAYGWELTYEEMEWLTGWLLVRGVDMLVPHAFYYSIEGPRKDERPPDVGPHNIWWDKYKQYADKCRRICWLNGEGDVVVDVAILTDGYKLAWESAKILFENQIDFLYLDFSTLIERGEVKNGKVKVGRQEYSLLICDGFDELPVNVLQKLDEVINNGRCIFYGGGVSGVRIGFLDREKFISYVRGIIELDVLVFPPCPGLRYRHIKYDSLDVYIFFNEGSQVVEGDVRVREKGNCLWLEPNTGKVKPTEKNNFLRLLPGEMIVLLVSGK